MKPEKGLNYRPTGMLGADVKGRAPTLSHIEMGNTRFKMEGDLDQYGMAVIQVTFYGLTFPGVIDTGSAGNHIRQDVITKLRLSATGIPGGGIHPKAGKFDDAQTYLLKYEVAVNVHIEDVFTEMVTEFHYPIILGTDFILKCHKFEYLSDSKRFTLEIHAKKGAT